MAKRPNWEHFRKILGKFYLHDNARINPDCPPNERFYVTSSPIPGKSMIYVDRGIRKMESAKRYLSAIWGYVAREAAR